MPNTLGYILSEFKFGFELEAFFDTKKTTINKVIKFLDSYFTNGDIDEDEPIKPPLNAWSFEYKSPVLAFKPSNLSLMLKLLKGLESAHISTNKSCGFHVHLSFPNLTSKELIWVVCHLALDTDIQKKIFQLQKLKFVDPKYADASFLKKLHKKLTRGDLESVKAILDSENIVFYEYIPKVIWNGGDQEILYAARTKH